MNKSEKTNQAKQVSGHRQELQVDTLELVAGLLTWETAVWTRLLDANVRFGKEEFHFTWCLSLSTIIGDIDTSPDRCVGTANHVRC